MNTAAPDRKSLLRYSFIALPLSFAGLPLYIHMPDFYTTEFGINLGLLGIILLCVRAIDALQDPVIGYLCDRLPHHRNTIITGGVLMLGIGMLGLCFGAPIPALNWLWFASFMILATTGFSIITININMIGGFWHNTPTQRARISSWREGFGLIGLLLAAILPTLLQLYFPPRISFIIMAAIFIITITAAFICFRTFLNGYRAPHETASRTSTSTFALLSILNGRDKHFFLICFVSTFAASLPAALVLFFIRDYLGAEELSGLFMALYFLSGAGLIGVWSKIATHHGLYKTWAYAMILSVVTFIGACVLSPGDVIAYGLICILSGAALGADLALPPAIIAGRIAGKDAQNHAAQYYAFLAFLPKIAMALAAAATFIALDFAGFTANAQNSQSALTVLVAAYALAPCILKIFSAALLLNLITKEGHNNETIERSIDHGITRIS